ncbi:MAG: hypothetical protein WA840_19715, partial [Caulobacteraceae bacterium]
VGAVPAKPQAFARSRGAGREVAAKSGGAAALGGPHAHAAKSYDLTDPGGSPSRSGSQVIDIHLTADPVYLYDAATGAKVGTVTLKPAAAKPSPAGVAGSAHPAAGGRR